MKPRTFVPSDLVLRKVLGNTKNLACRELGLN